MGKKMFVGGLPYEMTELQLSELFKACGQVVSAKVIKDRDTGLSKGFGFVEMGTDAEAAAAIAKLNSCTVGTRRIIVNEARPMEPRVPGAPEKKSFGPRPGGFTPRPGGFGDKSGGFGTSPDFGPDKGGFGDKRGRGDKRGGKGDKRGGFDEKRGRKDGFGGKKGNKGRYDDDGGDSW